jgi:hypothetical protein
VAAIATSFGIIVLLSPHKVHAAARDSKPALGPAKLQTKLTSCAQPPRGDWVEEHVARQIEQLRELASWYREYAERTGNPVIWDARIRTAEDLEAEAARLEGEPRFARIEP